MTVNKKRQILAIILCLLFAILFMATFEVCVLAESETDVETDIETEESTADYWETYVKDKLVPIIILVVSAIGTIIIAIAPVLAQVKSSARKFIGASEDVKTTSNTSKAMHATVDGGLKDIKKMLETEREENQKTLAADIECIKKALDADYKAKDAQIRALERKVDRQYKTNQAIMKIVTIAFSNSTDLVNSGYATQITRIAQELSNNADGETEDDIDDEEG